MQEVYYKINEKDIEIIRKIIYNKLCFGKVKETSKKEDLDIKVYDTTKIHAIKAVNKAINS